MRANYFFLLLAISVSGVAHAQSAAGQAPRPAAGGGLTYDAARMVYRSTGIRLEGAAGKPASISSPEVSIQAGAIAFDLEGSSINEVRALGQVRLKLNMKARQGGEPLVVNANADSAVLVREARKLTLKGNLSGFYQMGPGSRIDLKGDNGVFSYLNDRMQVNISGGKEKLLLTLPAEAASKGGALGKVSITASNFDFDSASGLAKLTGGARAVSSEGQSRFDLSAPEFQLTRGADGTLALLRCVGKTQVKASFGATGLPAVAVAGGKESGGVGRPTRLEATADGAEIDRATSTLTFAGQVKGYYTLTSVGGNQNFDFSGSKAVFKYVTAGPEDANAGLNVEVENANIQGPGFDFGF